jgi:hypothetical protein
MMLRGAVIMAGLALTLASCGDPRPVGTEMIVMPATASDSAPEEASRPVLAFDDTLVSFGVVSEGHVFTHTFSFVNEGPGMALIADVSTTCGCTVPKTWPRDPLAPGDRGEVEVSFDTHEKSGEQDKVVSVVANTEPGVIRLHLVGTVVSPDGL